MNRDFTVGVEEEYQLVDPSTGALRSRARDVLSLDWTEELRGELHEATLEIGTRICESAGDLRAELSRLRFLVGTTAAAEGVRIVAAGTHPFSRWEGQRHMPGERYARLLEQYGRIAWDELNFGMHVHVAVPEELDRVALMDRIRSFLPHLLALSASSPYHEGIDTGFASFRMILWRRWPYAGVPPRFGSEKRYQAAVRTLLESGAISDPRNVYWSIRPHPVYPTLEFRVTDVCPRLDDAVAIATLARALVIAAAEDRLPPARGRPAADGLEDSLLTGNEWLAARHGLDASLLDPAAGWSPVATRTAVRRLLDCVAPAAESVRDAEELSGLEALLARGNGADRMRRTYREEGGFLPLMEWLAAETLLGTGLDRRRAQREHCA